jgi:hypothetical protein
MRPSGPPEPTVVRTWKRDGTTNRMDLSAAVENLATAQEYREGDVDARRQIIRQELLDGLTLHTAKARFTIEAGDAGE